MTNITLGRPMGIRVSVHWTFWLLPAFVLFANLGTSSVLSTGMSLAVLFAVFGCVALHELGHAAAAKLFGIGTRDIVLYPLGGVANLERMPRNPIQEIVVALAGPAVNVAIAGLLLPLVLMDGYGTDGAGGTLLGAFAEQLLIANLFLVAFNMLPAFPMDGGRVFRAALALFVPRVTATNVAASVGTGFAILFGVLGTLGMMGVVNVSPMLLVLAVFLFTVGQAEAQGVREEEAERRVRGFRGVRLGWPVAQPAYVPRVTDGWEFNADNGMWTKWERGQAVGRYRHP
jgi:Zn-dependent protease